MINKCEETHIKIFRKHITSTLLILLVVSAITFSNPSYANEEEEEDPELVEWKCPSCPQSLPNPTKPPSPSPPPTPTTISHLVFAIGSSTTMWRRRSSYTTLWWDPLTMRGHVWLDTPSPSPSIACPPIKTSPRNFSRFGDRATASRLARIVADSYELGLEEVRWFVMGDDDTVFFAENLVRLLGRLDHEEMYYVGMASESVEQDEVHSYGMAFGGGGYAVSVGAARELAKVLDGCLERYRGMWGGDQRVQACLAELGVPLTRAPGFHQVDLRGNAYGMLAAHPIAPLISLHHLDAIDPISPLVSSQLNAVESLILASKYDSARTLQQTICYVPDDSFQWWSVSVSWGYTVQIYPWVLPPTDLEVPLRTFQTWGSYKDGPFTFNTRPFRSGTGRECERPVLFFLDRINKEIVNGTVSEYLRYDPPNSKVCGKDGFAEATKVESVRVFAPQLDQNVWLKAPRRQCCETRMMKRGKTLEVKIRDCYAGEVNKFALHD